MGVVHLTFDDGPEVEWTSRVLEELGRVRARGTFFVIGEKVSRHPDLIRQALEAGHAVELHCMRHLVHTSHWRATVEADTREALDVLGAIGVRPSFWRSPGGARSSWTAAIAEAHGLRLIRWSADTFDWRGHSAEAMLERIEPELKPGAVVLMHDAIGPGAPRPDCSQTVALIEPLVGVARARGLEPAPLGTEPALGKFDSDTPSYAPRRRRAVPSAEVSVLDEEAIPSADRAAIQELLVSGFPRAADQYGPEGWRTIRPDYRSLCHLDGVLTGQLSIFEIQTEPVTVLHGFGDAVVAEAHRGAGIARAIFRAAVEESWRRGAEIILVDTVALKPMLLSWGFEAVPRFAIYYERDGSCRWHTHWIAALRARLPPARLRLTEGDF